jgi:hypothetical protein
MGRSLPGAIHDQELVFQEKRLRDQGTDATRSEQPGQRSDQVDNKNGQIAHRRIVAGWEILRNHGRNNNSPGTRFFLIYATKLLLIKTGLFRDKNSLHLDALDAWTRQRLPAFRLGCACQQGKCIHEIGD